ncbi:pyridoxal phosphate-dependent aminotransferase [Vibrio vulnificus]|uniref:cysteine-S-conjugate beta-lyase n=1 Tax=Vibrio vulnificus TaxID=672 RepID=A0ABX4X212_VIBVL|nr:MalY/PatB family protein [Vibrio vulnificus]EGQ9938418.1 pyridoxal phosphate-dependent aminotransferase [Vibrio vulnificus]EGR0051911.1 pyridoxal phosphate-dependent aminotransferase [Vibrio vulnificus]EID4376023.1 pyridoxal phosphate-dependent aminotransferase [Vibrio vulnificus]KHF86248.1 bifunctional beta-cystathionase/maltose regulon regulatory protein [Vibrio vulnificus]KHF88800.1 bifunctional beta-cystathionase/maltose regulon regulatory protein [Vibrio vulnificus]
MNQNVDFDTPIDRTGTYCTQWDYVQDRFGKSGLLPFTISDMDFAAPDVVLKALKQRLEHPVLGYSRWNHDDFKSAISHWYQTRFDCSIDQEQLVYGPSVIYIISKLIELWTTPGQGVVFHTPAYDAFDNMIEGQARQCVRTPLIKQRNRFEIDWQDLESKLADANNRVLLLCSPHNPTGRVWSQEELQRIADLCDKHDVKVISDEIHMDVSFQCHTPYVGFGRQTWAVVTSASKSFNIPALNGAYALISEQSTREQYLHKLKAVDGLSSPSILGVLATMAAYREGEVWLDALKDYVRANHQFVRDSLEQAFPEVHYVIPEATYLAWIDLSPLNLDMVKLNRELIDHFNVAIMSGDVYGEVGKGYLRLNLGCPRSKVELGVKALIGAIKLLRESDV